MASAVISKGKACFVIQRQEPRSITVRCEAHVPELGRKCNQLVGESNEHGQLAGRYLCRRCKQVIEVTIELAKAST